MTERRANAFAIINTGDTREVVLARFGRPSHIERPGALFTRYASQQCQNPCVERLWFENRLTLDIEAWSVTLRYPGNGKTVLIQNHHDKLKKGNELPEIGNRIH